MCIQHSAWFICWPIWNPISFVCIKPIPVFINGISIFVLILSLLCDMHVYDVSYTHTLPTVLCLACSFSLVHLQASSLSQTLFHSHLTLTSRSFLIPVSSPSIRSLPLSPQSQSTLFHSYDQPDFTTLNTRPLSPHSAGWLPALWEGRAHLPFHFGIFGSPMGACYGLWLRFSSLPFPSIILVSQTGSPADTEEGPEDSIFWAFMWCALTASLAHTTFSVYLKSVSPIPSGIKTCQNWHLSEFFFLCSVWILLFLPGRWWLFFHLRSTALESVVCCGLFWVDFSQIGLCPLATFLVFQEVIFSCKCCLSSLCAPCSGPALTSPTYPFWMSCPVFFLNVIYIYIYLYTYIVYVNI